MASLNKVFMIGNLTRDPELRYIPSGTAVASFTLASNRVDSSAAGEKKEEACFVRVVAWARQAELCGEYLTKGSPVFVEGRLQSRSWETPDGQKRSTLELVAQNIQFLGRGSKGAGDSARAAKVADSGMLPDEPPAGSETVELPPDGEDTSSGEVPF